jgi:hypothetical protein
MTSVPFVSADRGSAAARKRLVTPIFRVEQIAISFSFRTWNRGTIARLRVGNLAASHGTWLWIYLRHGMPVPAAPR